MMLRKSEEVEVHVKVNEFMEQSGEVDVHVKVNEFIE